MRTYNGSPDLLIAKIPMRSWSVSVSMTAMTPHFSSFLPHDKFPNKEVQCRTLSFSSVRCHLIGLIGNYGLRLWTIQVRARHCQAMPVILRTHHTVLYRVKCRLLWIHWLIRRLPRNRIPQRTDWHTLRTTTSRRRR